MFNFLHRKYHYFVIVKTDFANEKQKTVAPKVFKFIKKYFFWRGRSVKYFEPIISKDTQEAFVVFGTAKGERTVNRNCLIFLLELFAAVSAPSQYKISNDFTRTTKTIGGQELQIYRIKK